jgi:murein DD-endopeptidase MepM/ murein hydrolase activator NlpD
MGFLSSEGSWIHAAVAVVSVFIMLGLLAAGFALSAGGDAGRAREAVEGVAGGDEEEEDRPASVWAGPLRLPTDNIALFKQNGGSEYFQFTARFENGVSAAEKREPMEPWQAGTYGFVRSPVRTEKGIIYTRYHEAIDIQATRRDERGEPLDTVRAVGPGTVSYVNQAAGGSNYGRYVVVEHEWSGAPYYSLYAHLSEVSASTGERVQQGEALGRMGYTGAGINRRRAHVHFEFNVLLNNHFQRWIDKHFGGNAHGIYSGLNMRGWNPAAYFKALRDDSDLTPAEFIRGLEPYYKIAFPRNGPIDMLSRYPWMRPEKGKATANAQAWEMSFTRGGFPLKVEPYGKSISEPTVTMDPPMEGVACSHLTFDHLRGRVPGCTMAPRGSRYIDLITMQGAGETDSGRAW